MKLLRCYVENFGKLQGYKHEFEDGLNTIKEENGFGKTTFATFIKSMFYGLDASARAENSERKRYKPWQGGVFGGNLEFEIDGKQYRIERTFGTKQADDTFILYDLETNLESKKYTENIGEEIFKISKSAYERSTYIPQGQIQIEMEDSISAKLGNVLESENDINSSDEAIKKLAEGMKLYKKIGGKGLINEKKNELNELQRKLDNSKSDLENLEARKKILEEKNNQIKEFEIKKEEKQKILTKIIEQGRKQAKQETYNNILKNLQQNEEKYNSLNKKFEAGVPTEEQLNNLSTKYIELEKCKIEIKNNELSSEEKEKYTNLAKKFEDKQLNDEEINQKIIYCSKVQEINNELQKLELEKENLEKELKNIEAEKNDKTKKSKILFILSILVFIIGIVLIILNIKLDITIIGALGAVLGIIISVLESVKRKNKTIINSYKDYNAKIESVESNINDTKLNKDVLESKINNLLNMFYQKEFSYQEKIIVLTELKAEYNLYKDIENKKISKEELRKQSQNEKNILEEEIYQFLLNYFEDISSEHFSTLIQELKIKKNEFMNISSEYEKAKKIKIDYEKNNNVDELMQEEKLEEISESELSTEIEELSDLLNKLNDEKSQNKNQIEILENKIDEIEYIEADIENAKEQLEKAEEKYNILEKTKSYLETAKETFSSSYLKEMVTGFKEYLKLIDDKDLITNVDINLEVKVDANGAKREIKNFSAGYKDLIYICMRLSLINALFKDEKPFIILDDPLVNLDDEKTDKAKKLIKKIAENNQVIYFICNESRK